MNSFGINCSQPCQCQNGATCNNIDGSCSCTIGYTGTICDMSKSNCLIHCVIILPCYLACPEGFYGQDCSQTCDCLNGATCSPFDGTCTCAEGYTGTRCETRKLEPTTVALLFIYVVRCSTILSLVLLSTAICTNPCQNGGTCIAPETCQCTEFLGGPTCEVRKYYNYLFLCDMSNYNDYIFNTQLSVQMGIVHLEEHVTLVPQAQLARKCFYKYCAQYLVLLLYFYRCPSTHIGARCETRNRGGTGRLESEDESDLSGGIYHLFYF